MGSGPTQSVKYSSLEPFTGGVIEFYGPCIPCVCCVEVGSMFMLSLYAIAHVVMMIRRRSFAGKLSVAPLEGASTRLGCVVASMHDLLNVAEVVELQAPSGTSAGRRTRRPPTLGLRCEAGTCSAPGRTGFSASTPCERPPGGLRRWLNLPSTRRSCELRWTCAPSAWCLRRMGVAWRCALVHTL